MGFLYCCLFLMTNAVVGFVLGRVVPKRWFNPARGIFQCFPFEKEGKIYEKLGIRFWQNRVPDMSKWFPDLMPPKALKQNAAQQLPVMLQETCVAEAVHLWVGILGFYCLHFLPTFGGVVITLVHFAFLNLPFILIQRYNRPRLLRLYRTMQTRKENCFARDDFDLCDRAGA